MIREARESDLKEILQLYLFLHETEIPEDSQHLRNTWKQIIEEETLNFYRNAGCSSSDKTAFIQWIDM